MKIALIGPGVLPIPPQGWGGIEIVMWKHYQQFTALGHEVTIFNSQDLDAVAAQVNAEQFDFIHLHYDLYGDFFVSHLLQPFCITSHYGYFTKEERWAKGFFSVFAKMFLVPKIIALSSEIKNKYRAYGYKGPIEVVRVGTDVFDFKFEKKGNSKAICLGKIEPRKKQALLASMLDNKISIDFIGPIDDVHFQEGETTRYGGIWTREEVMNRMTEYSTLVLFSDGEAAPGVVPEAFAAGLSVVISQSASANLDPKDFIHILSDDEADEEKIVATIAQSIAENDQRREIIRQYAEQRFDNKIIAQDYVQVIEKLNAESPDFAKRKKEYSTLVSQHRSRYLFSRGWFLLSQNSTIRRIWNYMKGK
jgi:glycosyltransferase involved in cell wall biosynthesis